MRHPKFRGLGFRVQGVGICTFAASSPTMPGARQKHRSLTIFSQHSAKHAHSQINHCSIFRTIARRRLPCRSWSTSRSVLVVELRPNSNLFLRRTCMVPTCAFSFRATFTHLLIVCPDHSSFSLLATTTSGLSPMDSTSCSNTTGIWPEPIAQ